MSLNCWQSISGGRFIGRLEPLWFRLAQDTVWVIVLKSVSMGLIFLQSIFLARLLGVKEFGLYAFAMSLAGLLSGPATFGFPQLLVREIAAYKVKGEWGLAWGLIRFSQRTAFLVSLALMLMVGFGLWIFSDSVSQQVFIASALALLTLPPSVLLHLQGSALRGFGSILLGEAVNGVLHSVCFILFLGGAWLFVPAYLSASLALSLQVIGADVSLLIGSLLLSRYASKRVLVSPNEPEQINTIWMRSALWLVFMALLNLMPQYGGPLVLGAIKGTEEVGLYKIAYQAASFIPFGFSAVSVVIEPMISQFYAQRDLLRLRRLVIVSTVISVVMALPFVLLFTIGGPWFLKVVFGDSYLSSGKALAVLAVAFVVQAAIGPTWHALLMSGYEQILTKISILVTLTYVLASLLLIPLIGVVGAAVSMLIYFILAAVLVIYFVKC